MRGERRCRVRLRPATSRMARGPGTASGQRRRAGRVGGRRRERLPAERRHGAPRRVAISRSPLAVCAAVQGRDTTSPTARRSSRSPSTSCAAGEVTFVSTCQGVPTYTDDSVEARHIAGQSLRLPRWRARRRPAPPRGGADRDGRRLTPSSRPACTWRSSRSWAGLPCTRSPTSSRRRSCSVVSASPSSRSRSRRSPAALVSALRRLRRPPPRDPGTLREGVQAQRAEALLTTDLLARRAEFARS